MSQAASSAGGGGLHVLPEISAPSARPVKLRPPGSTPWLSGLMIAVLGVTPVVAYLGNLAFAPLVALAGLACAVIALRGPKAPRLALIGLLALLAWALVSLVWTPILPHGLKSYKAIESFTALKLVLQLPLYAAFVVAAGRVSPKGAARALLVLAVGLVVIALIVTLEGFGDQKVYMNVREAVGQGTRPDFARRDVARAAYALALFLWPSVLTFQRRWWAAAALAILAAAGALLLKVDAPIVALVLGAAVWLAVGVVGRAGVLGAMVVVVGYLALAPLVVWVGEHAGAQRVAEIGKRSWGARTEAWRFTVDRIVEQPFIGHGLDSSRAYPEQIPLHPHDGALQIWLELGAPGAILAAFVAVGVFSGVETLRRRDPLLAGAAAASAAAYVVIGALSFGVWQEWWLALGALAAAVIRLSDRARGKTEAATV